MDIRTGRTYESFNDALADGVPEADIAEVRRTKTGEFEPHFRPKVKFTKGSFKPIKAEATAK